MAKSDKNSTKAPVNSQANAAERDLLEKLDHFIDSRHKVWMVFFLLLTLIGSFFLFDVKMSIGLDDSNYIIRAYDFAHKGTFPTFQGPLYPMLMSLPVSVWGINVILLKSFSVVFMLLHVLFFYLALKDKIPGTILFLSTLFISFNSYFLYYSSQTYTEAFYFMMQSLLIYVLVKNLDVLESNENIKSSLKKWLIIGFLVFACIITKNIGMGVALGLSGFFLLRRKWLAFVFSIVSLIVFYGPFEILKKTIWKVEGVQTADQGKILLYKDPYDFSKGKEDVDGFIKRFFDNADIYISKHLPHLWHTKAADNIELNGSTTFLISLFFILGLFWAFKKNKTVFLLGTISVVTLAVIFVVLQTRWDSDRLFIITVPYLTLLVMFGLYQTFKAGALKMIQPLLLIILIIPSLVMVGDTFGKMGKNYKIVKKNLAGDKLYGYTEDWRNFLLMSDWCEKNLPKDAYVMSRKAAMSTIYSNGRKFQEIYKLPSKDPDSLLTFLTERKVTHILHASLRRNPAINDGQIVTTTYNFLALIMQKYPQKFKMIKQIGEVEPAYLYELTK